MQAKMTLQGIEAYMNFSGRSIFDDIHIPELMDKDTMKDAIFYRADEFGSIYTDPEYLNSKVIAFFETNYRTFDKWFYALSLEYEPLYNYDRYEDLQEDTKDRRAGTTTNNRDLDRRVDNIGLDANTTDNDTVVITDQNTGNTNTVTKAVVNNTDYNPYDQTTDQGNNYVRETTDGTIKNTGSNENHVTEDTTDNTTTAEDITSTRDSKHTNHIYGNIGVTTSSKMLAEFILTNKKFNPYTAIADIFVQQFCIMCYI